MFAVLALSQTFVVEAIGFMGMVLMVMAWV